MAAFTTRSLWLLLLATVIVLKFPRCAASISTREYDSMQRVLRSRGYNLICNTMATSNLRYEMLNLPPNASFTIFAPTDASLFALDMNKTASSYTDTLRLHLVPLRLSLSDLRSISSVSILPTLLPYTALRLTTTELLQVAGVDVTLPGLFYSRRVAVHGLAGILSLSSVVSYGSPIHDDGLVYRLASGFGDFGSKIMPDSHVHASTAEPAPRRVAGDVLRARGWTIFAVLLEAQAIEFRGTLFAELDTAVENYANRSSEYATYFRSRLVLKVLNYSVLISLASEGSVLQALDNELSVSMEAGEVVVGGDGVVIEANLVDTVNLKVHLLRSKRLLRRPGLFPKRESAASNLVSKGLNGTFGVVTIVIFVWALYHLIRNCIASFKDLPDKPKVRVDDYTTDRLRPTNVPNQPPEIVQTAPQEAAIVQTAPQDVPQPLEQQHQLNAEETVPLRMQTQLDIYIEKDRLEHTIKYETIRRLFRAFSFTDKIVRRIAIPFGMSYFLMKLFWSALEILFPNMHWGHSLEIGA